MTKKSKVPILTVPMTWNDRSVEKGFGTLAPRLVLASESPAARPVVAASMQARNL
jgi:hypothetical protein